jgi:hypothetical protein
MSPEQALDVIRDAIITVKKKIQDVVLGGNQGQSKLHELEERLDFLEQQLKSRSRSQES